MSGHKRAIKTSKGVASGQRAWTRASHFRSVGSENFMVMVPIFGGVVGEVVVESGDGMELFRGDGRVKIGGLVRGWPE